MLNNDCISTNQAFILTLGAAVGTVFLDQPSWVVEGGGRDGWLSIPIGYGVVIILAVFAMKLASLYPNKTIVEYLPQIVGKVFGNLLAFLYIAAFTMFAAIIVRISIEVLSLLMPETPPLAFSLLIVILVAAAALQGLEVFARTSQFFVPLICLGLIVLSLFSLNMADFSSFKPFLENGIMPVIKVVPSQIALGGEAVLFMVFWYPWLNRKDGIKRPVIWGIGLGSLVLLIVTITTISVFGAKVILLHEFPVYTQSQMILVLGFLHGFEGVLTLIWVAAAFVKSTVFFIPASMGTAQLLGIKSAKPVIIIMAVLVVILSLLPRNILQVDRVTMLVDHYLILPLTLLLPVLWVIARLRAS